MNYTCAIFSCVLLREALNCTLYFPGTEQQLRNLELRIVCQEIVTERKPVTEVSGVAVLVLMCRNIQNILRQHFFFLARQFTYPYITEPKKNH